MSVSSLGLVNPDWIVRRRLAVNRQADLSSRLKPAAENTTRSSEGFTLLHAGCGAADSFEDAHIPAASYLDTNRLETPETWNRRPRPEIAAVLGSLGIGSETGVVLYGRDIRPDGSGSSRETGQLAAFRAAAILIDAGVADLRLLDGGFDAWARAGLPVEDGPGKPPQAAVFEVSDGKVFIDRPGVERLLADSNGRLVDVRSWVEFSGEVSGYDFIAARGRIPGAVWGGENARTPANTLAPLEETAARWAAAGISRENRTAFYCGTGWRASEAWFAARLLGWDAVVYDGGWLEWGNG